jgi:altronate hydrolase
LKFIKITADDNVAVALEEIKKGDNVFGTAALSDIPAGHKIALCDIENGTPVTKYGCTIGYAKENIKAGEWVHTQTVKTGLSDILTYEYKPSVVSDIAALKSESTFKGYKRKNGKAAIRNDLLIIPTVGCVNSQARILGEYAKAAKAAQAAKYAKDADEKLQNRAGKIDSAYALTHPYGCSQMGGDQENTRKILADLITHPNNGGVLVVGLGCENSGVEVLKSYLGDYDTERVKFLICQDETDEIAAGKRLIDELSEQMEKDSREDIPLSELVIGLKCGGSDGLSGITANPVLGRITDILVSSGGSTILTEVPEMFGAETLLMERAENLEVFDKIVSMINSYKNYFKAQNLEIYDNPSPGNKAGGITTLEDKSLGCTQKSGNAVVSDVLDYGEKLAKKGLNLLTGPGNDLVSATALAASGAHMVLFTTGRGTPFSGPLPTVKISSNTPLYEKKTNWIDFNAGQIVSEEKSIDETANELLSLIIKIASGEKCKSELANSQDFAILKGGVTL